MAALRKRVFVSVSNDKLPKINSNVLQSMLFKVRLLSINIGQWRKQWEVDSLLEQQIHGWEEALWIFQDKIDSIIALKASIFVSVPNNVPTKKRVCVKKIIGWL